MIILDRTAGIQHGSRNDTTVDTFLVHTIEGYLEGAENIFQGNTGRTASTHYGIGADGEVRRWVAEADRAYGARGWNHRSIHCELEGFAKQTEYPTVQMNNLVELLSGVLSRNTSIPRLLAAGDLTGVKGHGDVDPDRRWDPGYIDVAWIVRRLKSQFGLVLEWHPDVVLSVDNRELFSESWLVHSVQRTVGAVPDGQYGPITEAAVATHQIILGVFVDGKWGKDTWAAHMRGVAVDVPDPVVVEPTPEPEPEPEPIPEPVDPLLEIVAKLESLEERIESLEASGIETDAAIKSVARTLATEFMAVGEAISATLREVT